MFSDDQSGQYGGAVNLSADTLNRGNTDRKPTSEGMKCDPQDATVVVERNDFLRDCLQRSASDCLAGRIVGCRSLSEWPDLPLDGAAMVLLSTISLSDEEADEEMAWLTKLDPRPRSMVLGKNDDLNKVLFALSQGANGYISMNTSLDIVIQAVRFVAAGGTYVPAQCVLEAKHAPAATPEQDAANALTAREMSVIQAIRQGKPNKVIAYELNMCESTVKVHVRHIMKKLHARNRTDVAIKSADLPAPALRREWPRSADTVRVLSLRR